MTVRPPERAPLLLTHLDLTSNSTLLRNVGENCWEHSCHPAMAVLYDCRRTFPSPCLLEGQDPGQCCLVTEIIVTKW